MATGRQSWVEDMYDVAVQWHEFCTAAMKGRGSARTDENFVLRPVWHKYSRVLAFVHPETLHISIIGEGLDAKINELRRLAVHAFHSKLGDALFPPLCVRMGGAEARFRWVGHGYILAFAGSATGSPRHDDPVVVLAALPRGYTLVAIHERRTLLIAQGGLQEIAGLDLDPLDVWETIRSQKDTIGRLPVPAPPGEAAPARLGSRSGSGSLRRVLAGSQEPLEREDLERFAAILGLAMQASVIDEIPVGVRGRRELPTFLDDMVRFAGCAMPDPKGSPSDIGAWMGKVLRMPSRSARAVYAVLGLLEQHGQRNRSEILVSRPMPHQWCVHCSDLADPGSDLCRSLLARWPAWHAILAEADEPVSDEEVVRSDLNGRKGGVRKAPSEGSDVFSLALSHEFELRCQREAELRRMQVSSYKEAQALRGELDSLRQQLAQANAENVQRAAYVAESDARLERLHQQAANGVEQVAALAAELAVLDRNKDLVRTCIDAVNRRDWTAVQMLLAPGFIQHDPVSVIGHVPGADELAPNPQHIDSLIAEGDLVAAHLRADAGAGPGREVTHIRIYRIAADQIAEVWGA